MEDNKKFPEIISAVQRDNRQFAVVKITIGEESRKFEMGLGKDAYKALGKIFRVRPFGNSPGMEYHYFFINFANKVIDETTGSAKVRIVLDHRSKTVNVPMPSLLAQNLMWFSELKDFEKAKFLKEVNP